MFFAIFVAGFVCISFSSEIVLIDGGRGTAVTSAVRMLFTGSDSKF